MTNSGNRAKVNIFLKREKIEQRFIYNDKNRSISTLDSDRGLDTGHGSAAAESSSILGKTLDREHKPDRGLVVFVRGTVH